MIRKLIFFFPLQLLLVNLKRNHLLLLLWLILFGFVSNSIAGKYGIHYLFLAPEYLNTVSIWSYSIVGFAIGGFVMTFNISSYIINSKRFPFIAALKRPFLKFCINNSLLPLIFITYYVFQVIHFHIENENSTFLEITAYVFSFLIGYVINIIASLTYFLSTNKNIFKKFGISASLDIDKPINSLFTKQESIYNILKRKNKWHVEIYLHSPFIIKPARNIMHYDKKMLKSIISQNHLNASFFELIIFISLIVLGLFSENPIFIIPAGASIILFFTIVFILMSAFYTWLKGWTTIAFISLFILFNSLSKNEKFTYDNMAYGLNYISEKADYSILSLNKLRNNKENLKNDKTNSIKILDNWKRKFTTKKKPKIIFINCSGGGSRAMLWTFQILRTSDSLTNGMLFKQAHLITGSSGGMIGASYFRELYLQKEAIKHSIYSKKYLDNVSKDLLNPIAFNIATNDFFFRFKKYHDGNYTYTKDRGYAFERQLLLNTNVILNKRLRDYVQPEFESKIPMLILSPTVINDGRRMLISPQPISYLISNSTSQKINNQAIIENFEFTRLFEKQDAANLKSASALRMSATFPIIMPRVSLPTTPQITVMDAGMRDNFGKLTTYKYIDTFKEWIDNNTSGVIIITIRDKQKHLLVKENSISSITETFLSPVGSLYKNLFPIQDYNSEEMLNYLGNDFKQSIDIIDFELNNNKNEISLSWHLTTKEKEKVLNSISSKKSQESLKKLKNLLNQ
ncbi:MAG: patatin-like phospholipase family protein [Flavobacteriales bacterium]|nr:patatin-like phospholipase family protein [Flavobacteriales bacterium]